MTTIFVATMETSNFSFQGYGTTYDEAVQALRAAWNKHAQQYQDREVAMFDEPVDEGGSLVPEYFGMAVYERVLGQGYRDHEALN
jgi:hypothetical protein